MSDAEKKSAHPAPRRSRDRAECERGAEQDREVTYFAPGFFSA